MTMRAWPAAQSFESLNRVLEELLALPATEREPTLSQWQHQHPEGAELLVRLLAAAESESTAFDNVLGRAVANSLVKLTGAGDEHLGDWRLTHWLGRGGMAEVWLAVGSGAHSDQRAAIKRLARDTATPEFIARFAQERRILATLDDPRIARLLDGGVSAEGQPWLAMEYVDGEPIDVWCDQHKLDLVGRVRLLRDVAVAVHTAHRALIVHRDIKPANVMVTTDGHVKLLDFGIAKLLGSPQADAPGMPAPTLAPALTPQYASPEQFLGDPVTTATDVYQLGVLMVELLTGVRPFQSCSDNLVELAHAVVSEDPPAPSQALKRAGIPPGTQERILLARRITARRLQQQLRGDLDAIAHCAMAREPRQRYSSALQFSEDLDAWLGQRPVRARTPALVYRAQRFLSRNWLASGVAVALVLVLVAYVGTVLVQSAQIRREADLNRLVRNYLVELLREADPRFTRTPHPSAERVMAQGMARAREQFVEQPDLLAELLGIGAEVQIGRGDYTRAAELLSEALALRRTLDPADPALTNVLGEYGRTLHYTARYAEAEHVLREAQSRWYASGARGTAWIAMALADVLHSRGEYDVAEMVLRRADAAQRSSGAQPIAHAELARDLGTVLRDAGRLSEALNLQKNALEQMRHLTKPGHGSALFAAAALAQTLVLDGQTIAARALINEVITAHRETYGEHHAVVGISRHTLALADELDGRLQAAEQGLDEVLSLDYASVPPGNVLLAYAHVDRAWLRLAANHDEQAAADLDAAEPTLRTISQRGHPRWSGLLLARAVTALRRGDRVAARAAIEQAVVHREICYGLGHPATLEARRWLSALDLGSAPPPIEGASKLETHRLPLLLRSRPDIP